MMNYLVIFTWPYLFPLADFKGTVRSTELNKCDIHLVSRRLLHKRITPFLEEWRLWHLIPTGNFPP